MGLPPAVLLRPEEAVSSLRPLHGSLWLRRGQRAVGRRQQQFRFLGGPAMGLLNVANRRIRLGQRLASQPGGQQCIAAVEAENERRNIQRAVTGGGLVKERKRCRKITRSGGGNATVEHRMDRFQFLAGFGEQPLQRQQSQHPRGQVSRRRGTPVRGLPAHEPPRPNRQRAAGCRSHGGSPPGLHRSAKRPQHKAAPVENTPFKDAAGQLYSPVKGSESVCRPACVDER